MRSARFEKGAGPFKNQEGSPNGSPRTKNSKYLGMYNTGRPSNFRLGLRSPVLLTSNAITGAVKRNTFDLELGKEKTKVGKQGVRPLYLFENAKYKLNSNLENLISFSVIYRSVYRVTSRNSRNMLH